MYLILISEIANFQCAFVWSPYHHVLYLIFVIVSVLFIHLGLYTELYLFSV